LKTRYKEKTPDVAKVDWSLIADRDDNSNSLNKTLLAFYRGLVLLRKENKEFFQTTLDFIHEDHNAKVLAYQRWYEGEGSF
jgi:1,4-alpha-glucan branching enzyme